MDPLHRIRTAVSADLSELCQLAGRTYVAAFGHTLSQSDLAAHLELYLSKESLEKILREDIVLVATDARALIGFVQFGRDYGSAVATEQEQAIRRLYVLAEHQNRGLGARLMSAALEHPRLARARRITLDVWEHNHGARRFYERHGFRLIGEHRFEVESGAQTDAELVLARFAVDP